MAITKRQASTLMATVLLLAGCGSSTFQSNRVRSAGNLSGDNKAIVIFTTIAMHAHTKTGWANKGSSAVSPVFMPVILVNGKYRRDPARKYFSPYLQRGEIRPYRVDAGAYILVSAYYRFTDENKRVTYRGPVFANRDNKPMLIRFSVNPGDVVDLGRLEIKLIPPLNRPRIFVLPNDRAAVEGALKRVADNPAQLSSLNRRLVVRPLEEVTLKVRPRRNDPNKS